MKSINLLFIILILNIFTVVPGFAKVLEENAPSTQLLKTLSQEGETIRNNDEPILKVDVTNDKTLVKKHKEDYYKQNQDLFNLGKSDKKNKNTKAKKTKKAKTAKKTKEAKK